MFLPGPRRRRVVRRRRPARRPRPSAEQLAVLRETWPAERLAEELDLVLERWGVVDLRAAIRCRWNPRLKSTIGRAVLLDMVIELNPWLLAAHPEEVRPVLVHEAAHLVVQRLHGTHPPHGRIWKVYMRKAGVSTRATHDLC